MAKDERGRALIFRHPPKNSAIICFGANGQFRESAKREDTVELAALGAQLTAERNEIINARTRARTTCLPLQRGAKVFSPACPFPYFSIFLATPDESRVARIPNAS